MNILLKQVPQSGQADQPNQSFWHTGFRPFFCMASLFAILVMPLWLLIRQGWQIWGVNYYGPSLWHVHEMVFGYGLAVIAGFMLTAIKTWTGIQTAQFRQLKLLTFMWVLGRVAPFIPGVSAWYLAVADCSFAVALVFFVASPLVKSGKPRNYKMIFIVAALAGLNMLTHVALLNGQMIWALQATQLALLLIILLIGVMAGRVFSMFSQNGVAIKYQAKIYPWVENTWPIFYLLLVILITFFRGDAWLNWLTVLLALINTALHGCRLAGWYNKQIWQHPLIWVLHVGYAFMVLGFLALAGSVLFEWIHYLALHLLTMGCLSLITLGMMARVSYGHTGRNLKRPPKILFWCFVALVLATTVRFLTPLVDLIPYEWTITVSVLLWVFAFGLFFIRYVFIWWMPRVDGKPG